MSIERELDIVMRMVAKLDNAPVECDGFVRLLSTALRVKEIDHKVLVGSLDGPGGIIPLHFWIECHDQIIDCRARMWLGEKAPHGVFEPDHEWLYEGSEALIEPLTSHIFSVLADVDLEDVIRD